MSDFKFQVYRKGVRGTLTFDMTWDEGQKVLGFIKTEIVSKRTKDILDDWNEVK